MLIIGGSTEASALVAALAHRPDLDAVLSLAGRTATPIAQPIETRIGGFGGVDGFVDYIERARIGMIVDATHPFAARMSENARFAAERAAVKLIRLTRGAWEPGAGDRWREVPDMDAAVAALGEAPRRVFLTVGRLQLAAFVAAPRHFYLVRTIEPVPPGHGLREAIFIQARGPFSVDDEEALMRRHAIDILVTKNSGGRASAAKIEAARRLHLPVVLVRPPRESGDIVTSVEAVIAAIDAHRAVPRGV